MRLELLDDIRQRVRGTVFGMGDPGYDEARAVYNGMIDRRPLAVIRCVNAADVMAVVNAARENGLDLAVRGGGHSVPGFGTCDGGLVADLSGMRGVRVDPQRRTARAEGGCTWGDLNHATYAFGLATTGGIISTTGVGGLTLGGGIGYLARKHGLSCDNLIAADVVLADGRLVHASEEEEPDLFWALRGGGGNFGIVTSFEYQLHPVKDIYGGPIFYALDDAAEVLRFYREWMPQEPRELGGFLGFHQAPPLPFIPEDRQLEPMCVMVTCWTGALDEGENVLKPLHDVAPVVGEHVGPMPYPMLNSAFDALVPPGLQHYWKSSFVTGFPDEAVEAHVQHGAGVPSVNTAVHLYPIDGAVHDVGADDTAFPYRHATFSPVVAGMWPDPADNERNIRWVKDYHAAIAPYSEEGGYINFMSPDDQGRVRANFGAHYDRLAEIKRRYDPENLFHVNQNIAPTH